MLTADIEDYLSRGLDRMGLSLDRQPESISRLVIYFNELKKWNRKINLVARTLDDRQILENHFLDSLTLLSLLPPYLRARETILDVGTGAGFPGLVVKAACPELSVTLIEPRKNRFFFLKHMVRVLNVKDIDMLNIRLEEKIAAKELSGRQYSLITSRAFTDMGRFVKIAAPYLGSNGRIVLMKGPGSAEELHEFVRKGAAGKFVVAETRKFNLPFSNGERLLVSVRRSG